VTKAIKVMRLKTDRRGGVAFPGTEEVFIVAPCDVERRCQSARRLFAAFVEDVKICKACLEVWLGRQPQATRGPGPVGGCWCPTAFDVRQCGWICEIKGEGSGFAESYCTDTTRSSRDREFGGNVVT
jgi:hypothetical protein